MDDVHNPFDAESPLPFAPWRLSGCVVGTLLNDPAELRALGAAAHAAPYKAPPRQPVLYLKPRNTLMTPEAPCALPAGAEALVCGVSLGLVVGRTLCRASEDRARHAVAALTVVVDLHVPHPSVYRPSVPMRALDASCRFSPPIALEAGRAPDPDNVDLDVVVAATPAPTPTPTPLGSTRDQVRTAARLLSDISAFMTLRPGDVVMTGVRQSSVLLRAGEQATARAQGVGAVTVSVARAGPRQGHA